jgi:hypothetical protein
MSKLSSQIIGATIATLVAVAPVQAQKATPKDNMPERAEEALKEGMETMLKSLQRMFKAIPQYEMPEVLENGDIIIRRKKPADKKAPDDTDST